MEAGGLDEFKFEGFFHGEEGGNIFLILYYTALSIPSRTYND